MKLLVRRSVSRGSRLALPALLAVIITLIAAGSAGAAPGGELWAKTWKPPGTGRAYTPCIVTAPTGDVFLVAAAVREGKADADIAVVRYTSGGTRKWVKYWDSPGHKNDAPVAVAADRDGNVIVYGSTQGADGKPDWVVATLSRTGAWRWAKVGGGAGEDRPGDIAVDERGNVYSTSMSSSATSQFWCETVKHSPSGRKLWTRRHLSMFGSFGIANVWYGGSLYVAAQDSLGEDPGIPTVVKYSPAGEERWISWWRTGDHVDHVRDIAASRYGVVVTGFTNDVRGIVARFTHGGTLTMGVAWRPAVGTYVYPRSCGISDAGTCYVAAEATYSSGAASEFVVSRFTAPATRVDVVRIAGQVPGAPAGAKDLIVTSGGKAYATGYRTLVPGGSVMLTAGWASTALWSTSWAGTLGTGAGGTSIALSTSAVYAVGVAGDRLVVAKYAR